MALFFFCINQYRPTQKEKTEWKDDFRTKKINACFLIHYLKVCMQVG